MQIDFNGKNMQNVGYNQATVFALWMFYIWPTTSIYNVDWWMISSSTASSDNIDINEEEYLIIYSKPLCLFCIAKDFFFRVKNYPKVRTLLRITPVNWMILCPFITCPFITSSNKHVAFLGALAIWWEKNWFWGWPDGTI